MQIIRVEGNIEKSRIDGKKVSDLPERLRTKMIELLNKLTGTKGIDIGDQIKDAIFELPDRNVTLDSFGEDVQKEFLETIGLLRWYLQPHWHSMSPEGTIGGDVQCADCRFTAVVAQYMYCPMPSCPSHEKWRMVIGPSFKPPDPPFFIRQLQGFLQQSQETLGET